MEYDRLDKIGYNLLFLKVRAERLKVYGVTSSATT